MKYPRTLSKLPVVRNSTVIRAGFIFSINRELVILPNTINKYVRKTARKFVLYNGTKSIVKYVILHNNIGKNVYCSIKSVISVHTRPVIITEKKMNIKLQSAVHIYCS